jgi:hypothetical protein
MTLIITARAPSVNHASADTDEHRRDEYRRDEFDEGG